MKKPEWMSWLALRRFLKNPVSTIPLKFKVLSHFDLMETCQDIAERQQHHHVAWIQIFVVFFWPRWAVFNRRLKLKLRMIPGGDPEEGGDKGAA